MSQSISNIVGQDGKPRQAALQVDFIADLVCRLAWPVLCGLLRFFWTHALAAVLEQHYWRGRVAAKPIVADHQHGDARHDRD